MLTTPSRWVLCVLLLLGTTINYLDRQTLSLMAPIMRVELGLNNENLGLLFSLFYYAYTFAQFAAGGLIDRSNLRWSYGGAVLLWSCVGALTALTTGFASLAVFRLLLGFTESPNWPGALKIVSRALPVHERAMGNGIFTSGQSIGALTAPLIILTIANSWGWRAGFLVVGLLGAAWFLLWAWFTRRPEFAPLWKPAPGERPVSRYGEILRNPKFWCVAVITSTINPILYFNVNWLPTYLNQERNVGAGSSEMRWILTFVFLGLDLGYLATGVLTRRFSRTAVFTAATALVTVAALVPWAASQQQLLGVLMISNFGLGMWMVIFLTLTQEVSKDGVSTAMGLAGGTGSLAGALLMWVVGIVTHRTGSFTLPFLAIAVAVLFTFAAGVASQRLARRAVPVTE